LNDIFDIHNKNLSVIHEAGERAGLNGKDRFHLLFERSLEPVILLSGNTIIDCNGAALKVMGAGAKTDLTGLSIDDISPPLQPDGRKSTEKARALSEEVLRDGCGAFEWVHRDLTGKEFWVEVFLTAISERAPMITFGTWRDITERKRAEKELRESYERLRMLSAHIQEVREYERKSIARELHDVLGQMLTTINMDLAWMKKKTPEKEKAILGKITAVISLVKQAVKTVQKVSSELRPVILEDFGLIPAIEHAAQSFQGKTGITTEVKLDPGVDLDRKRSIALYRIFQEVTTNVIRHAGATKLHVSLERDRDVIALEIRDNGRGVSDKEIEDKSSFGILGMRERALFIGGRFHIRGVPGVGTGVRVEIPYQTNGGRP